ncbi:ThiF family adenylyltransferase [Hymenobacter sp. BT635]|uniref:ThiF family adenylyltransferase n=1 Tax=Hymenobacter nitidus TaxID=2880929 RepID=A0ABS8AIQ8_9BACT|nr:ThiF family adenylyltransferase [Hymenobacter nitidus]MCB2380328.1 ThiF family adenylyltransferase [Hymenobacter nitidus]
MTTEALEAWLSVATATGLVLPPGEMQPDNDGGFRITTTLAVAGLSVGILIVLAHDFPKDAPLVLVQDSQLLGRLPHVFRNAGVVCYSTSEGLLLNRQQPETVLTWAVKETIRTLEEGLGTSQVAEFMRELEVYWRQLGGPEVVNFYNPSSEARTLTSYSAKDNLRWLAGAEQEMPPRHRAGNKLLTTIKEKATYLPLLPGTAFIPPAPNEPFWTIDQLRELVKPTLMAIPSKRRRQLFKSGRDWNGLLVLAVPLVGHKSHVTLLGIAYTSLKGVHPLGERGSAFDLKPVQLLRWERSYLLPRGGGKMSLTPKKVLVIGCGAIGGHLAHELSQTGILYLTLVDGDRLSIENMHRHALGMAGVGEYKAIALRDELQRKYLYAEVTAIAKPIEQALDAGEIQPESFDLVIAATGEATLERYLNERLRAIAGAPPVIYSWLEPYGIGGHALLTRPHQAGCLECLYTSPNPDAPLSNRALFAAPDQQFSLALSGCGSLHTPYASLDASQTATLAARLAVEALTSSQPESPLWSWKGSDRELKAAGFKVGPRYKLTEETLRRDAMRYIAPNCPVCAFDSNTNAATNHE